MYVTVRSGMSLIMALIGLELLELSALELEKLSYFTLFTLYGYNLSRTSGAMLNLTVYTLQISTNQHQTWSKCM